MDRLNEIGDALAAQAPGPPTLAQLQSISRRQTTRRQVGFATASLAVAGVVGGTVVVMAADSSENLQSAAAVPSQATEEVPPLGDNQELLSACIPLSDGGADTPAQSLPALDPLQRQQLKADITTALAGDIAGMYATDGGFVVMGTQPSPGRNLDVIASTYGVELTYRQVESSAIDLAAAQLWLTDLANSQPEDLDIRTAYIDNSCATFTVLVGNNATAEAIETQATADGHSAAITVQIRPDYEPKLRGPAQTTEADIQDAEGLEQD